MADLAYFQPMVQMNMNDREAAIMLPNLQYGVPNEEPWDVKIIKFVFFLLHYIIVFVFDAEALDIWVRIITFMFGELSARIINFFTIPNSYTTMSPMFQTDVWGLDGFVVTPTADVRIAAFNGTDLTYHNPNLHIFNHVRRVRAKLHCANLYVSLVQNLLSADYFLITPIRERVHVSGTLAMLLLHDFWKASNDIINSNAINEAACRISSVNIPWYVAGVAFNTAEYVKASILHRRSQSGELGRQVRYGNYWLGALVPDQNFRFVQ